MPTESRFYLQQAENCEREATMTALPNQRDMLKRSQAAWQALADRRLLTEANRAALKPETCGAPKARDSDRQQLSPDQGNDI